MRVPTVDNPVHLRVVNPCSSVNFFKKPTDIVCWWCTEPFDNCPVSLPVRHRTTTFTREADRSVAALPAVDQALARLVTKHTFDCYGVYCSWECAMAFASQLPDSLSSSRGSHVRLLRRLLEPHHEAIGGVPAAAAGAVHHITEGGLHGLASKDFDTERKPNAPPRMLLKKFGGPLTIEEFRAAHTTPGLGLLGGINLQRTTALVEIVPCHLQVSAGLSTRAHKLDAGSATSHRGKRDKPSQPATAVQSRVVTRVAPRAVAADPRSRRVTRIAVPASRFANRRPSKPLAQRTPTSTSAGASAPTQASVALNLLGIRTSHK